MGTEKQTRLERWIDEEVELTRQYDPRMSATREAEYRDALSKTLRGAQLRVADEVDELCRIAGVQEFGDLVYAHLKSISDGARDRSLRKWFRKHW